MFFFMWYNRNTFLKIIERIIKIFGKFNFMYEKARMVNQKEGNLPSFHFIDISKLD